MRAKIDTDKKILRLYPDKKKLLDQEARVYFEGITMELLKVKERYITEEEDDVYLYRQVDMYIFSKEELRNFVDLEIATTLLRLEDQGDL